MEIVILLSGGMDSTTLAHYLVDKGHNVYALAFDYGSKHNKKELECAKYQAKELQIPIEIINMTFLDRILESDLLQSGGDIPEGHYEEENMKSTVVPFRNGIMLSLATGFAESIKTDGVAIASHIGDHAIYPDCRKEFNVAFSEAMKLGTYEEIGLISYFEDKTKADIAALGHELGVDYSNTWSCYKGQDKHCGKCGTCFAEGSKVLMANGTTKEIQNVEVGDKVLAFSESKRLKYEIATVEKTFDNGIKETVELDGTFVTPDHKFLMYESKKIRGPKRWCRIGNGKYDNDQDEKVLIQIPVDSIKNKKDYILGFTKGFWDSDGSTYIMHKSTYNYTKMSLCQKEKTVLEELREALKQTINMSLQPIKYSEKQDMYYTGTQKQDLINKIENADKTKDYKKGYLAGFFVGDGSIKYRPQDNSHRIRFYQKEEMKVVKKYLDDLGLQYNENIQKNGKPGTKQYEVDVSTLFFLKVPVWFGGKKKENYYKALDNVSVGYNNNTDKKVIRKEAKERHVYDLQTSSGTYICDNYLVHNCSERKEAFELAGIPDPTDYYA